MPASPEGALEVVLALQHEAGLAPLTDGGLAAGRPLVDRWRAAAELAGDVPVKAIVAGPYSQVPADLAITDRERRMVEATEACVGAIVALADAGCPLVQVDEPAIERVGDDDGERRLFETAHRKILDGAGGRLHLTLALLGRAEHAGPTLLFGLSYPSYLFDLIGGPEDWRLITRAPTQRGIVCGVVPTTPTTEVVKEVLVWAAQYAASTNGRGLERVGLSTTGSLAHLPWETAVRRVRLLGDAARIAADDSFEHLLRELDPRALGMKSGAFGAVRWSSPRRRSTTR